MVYIKRFESIEREELDSYLLDHFLDLDEEYDVNMKCDNFEVSIQFEKRYEPRIILNDIWNRVVRIRSLGEFVTNNVWGEFGYERYGNIKYMVSLPSFRNQLYTGEMYFGDNEIQDFSIFIHRLSSDMILSRFYGKSTLGLMNELIIDIRRSLKISSISLEFKPSK
jgi:hypothetical protein